MASQLCYRLLLLASTYFILMMVIILRLPSAVRTSAIMPCPASCNCTQVKGKLLASCLTNQPQQVISEIPTNITHLLLIMQHTKTKIKQKITFENLSCLEVLILEQEMKINLIELTFHSKTFQNNKKLRVIKSHVALNLAEDTFLPLEALTELSLSNTMMGLDFLPKLTKYSLSNNTHLHTLSLSQFVSGWEYNDYIVNFQPEEVFSSMRSSPLINLDLSGNEIHFMNFTPFCKLFPSLQTLNISFNSLFHMNKDPYKKHMFWELMVFHLYCKNLETLDFGQQGRPSFHPALYTYDTLIEYIGHVDRSEDVMQISVETQRYVQMTNSYPLNPRFEAEKVISQLDCEGGLRIPLNSLKRLIGNNNKLYRNAWITNIGKLCVLPNVLSYVDFSWNLDFIDFMGDDFIIEGLNNLEYLNLRTNNIKLFPRRWFSNFTALQVLLLSGNQLGEHISNDTGIFYLCENHYLQTLDLAENAISEIPRSMFLCLKTLKFLNLSNNMIEKMDLDLENMHTLQSLNLSSNKLSTISKEMREMLNRIASRTQSDKNNSSFFEIDLTNNPLTCGCGDLKFIDWFQNSIVKIHNKKLYRCGHPFGGYVSMHNISTAELRMQCFPSKVKNIVVSVLISILCSFLVMLLGLLYCKRWHLRYWWYITKTGWKKLANTTDDTKYEYDAFVAYNHKDRAWVHHSLIQEMETKRGLKLCIHHRDFPGGEVLEEVIVDKIEKSHKTLLVLTPNFLESNWCHFELHMARSRLFGKGQDVLVLVILKPLPVRSLNGALYRLLKTKVYLEWTDDTQGQELFWKKLYDGLSDKNDCRPFD